MSSNVQERERERRPLTQQRLQLAQHECPHPWLIATTTILLVRVAHHTKVVADDRDKHAHTDEHHHEDEQAETEGTEQRRCIGQFSGVEFQQHHLEQRLCRLQQTGAGRECRAKQEIEQHEKGHEDDRVQHQKRTEILPSPPNGVGEQRQLPIELAKTQHFQDAEETAEAQQIGERVLDVDSGLKIDGDEAVCSSKEITGAGYFLISPHVKTNARP